MIIEAKAGFTSLEEWVNCPGTPQASGSVNIIWVYLIHLTADFIYLFEICTTTGVLLKGWHLPQLKFDWVLHSLYLAPTL